MKKILGMFLAVSIVLSGIGAFAETASPAPTETPQVTVEPTVSPGTTVGKYLPRSYSPPGGQSADPVSHHCHNHGISPDG